MSKVQTDNDERYLSIKIKLRQNIVDNLPEILCLECYGGDGVMWGEIKKTNPWKQITILRIDQKEDKKGIYLKGDNLKFIKNIDLNQFNIIDLDAYGVPVKQLDVLFKRKYKGWVVVTFIQSMTGNLGKVFLNDLGFTNEMIKKCPSIFNKNGFEKMKHWLGSRGIKSLSSFSENRKNYFSFYLDN